MRLKFEFVCNAHLDAMNPHLQYLLQLQTGQAAALSPQLAQLHLLQQQSLQRQQLLSHLQQGQPGRAGQGPLSVQGQLHSGGGQLHSGQGQPQSTPGVSAGPASTLGALGSLPAAMGGPALGGPALGGALGGALSGALSGAPGGALPQVPLIKEVWAHNLETEFLALRTFTNDPAAEVYIAVHQEIPGIVARPVGTFKSLLDYHFQTLRLNLDLLNLIQLLLCITKRPRTDADLTTDALQPTVVWQFNFLYDLAREMYNEEHLAMLAQTSLVNLELHMQQGIPHLAFAELFIESGVLLDTSTNWISYHGGYDLGFLISLLANQNLPVEERDFLWWCDKYFPRFFDLKYMGQQLVKHANGAGGGNSGSSAAAAGGGGAGASGGGAAPGLGDDKGATQTKPSIEYLAEELRLLPISPIIRQYFAQQASQQSAAAVASAAASAAAASAITGGPNQSSPRVAAAAAAAAAAAVPTAAPITANHTTSTLHAYLLMECFKELLRLLNAGSDPGAFLAPFRGLIWGLTANQSALVANGTRGQDYDKSGAAHFGRA